MHKSIDHRWQVFSSPEPGKGRYLKSTNLTSSMKPARLLFASNTAGLAKTVPGPDANLC